MSGQNRGARRVGGKGGDEERGFWLKGLCERTRWRAACARCLKSGACTCAWWLRASNPVFVARSLELASCCRW